MSKRLFGYKNIGKFGFGLLQDGEVPEQTVPYFLRRIGIDAQVAAVNNDTCRDFLSDPAPDTAKAHIVRGEHVIRIKQKGRN